MQLLLLLLPVCALALLSIEEIRERAKGRLERRFGQLSPENKEKLKKAFGQDPEARKARLERMLKRKLNRSLTNNQKKSLEKKLAEIPKIHTVKPNENATVDLFELNLKEGVSDYFFQGDIYLTDAQLNEIESELSQSPDALGRKKRQASTIFSKWTDNTVYYYFDPSIDARKRASTAAAVEYLQSIYNGAGCNSAIGMDGGVQDMSIGDGCEVFGTVAHEFTHALGFFHTQSRSDRDEHVTIDLSDVKSNRHGNFVKLRAAENALHTPYEYGSFMQYAANSFVETEGKLSIVPHDTKFAYTMGNRLVSFYDIQMINDHYGCTEKCLAATSAKCKNGGVPNPRNCNSCNCPLGYAGALCDQRPVDAGCGETLAATANWKSKEFLIGDQVDSTNVRDIFTMCNHWITAPAGKKVQTRITSMFNPQCQYGCPFNGIEIKTDANPQVTNPRICCDELNNIVYTSELNPTPVVAFNRFYFTTFKLEYRYVDGNGVVPTTKPTPAPITTTTTAQATNKNCVNMNQNGCAENVLAGFCSMIPEYGFQAIKYNCGPSCGLCGKAAPECVDLHTGCEMMRQYGMCNTMHPMQAEYNCAKTCGYCENPN